MAERITITIETEGAAFEDSPASEVARILSAIARAFEDDGAYRFSKVYDINGNACGSVKVESTK